MSSIIIQNENQIMPEVHFWFHLFFGRSRVSGSEEVRKYFNPFYCKTNHFWNLTGTENLHFSHEGRTRSRDHMWALALTLPTPPQKYWTQQWLCSHAWKGGRKNREKELELVDCFSLLYLRFSWSQAHSCAFRIQSIANWWVWWDEAKRYEQSPQKNRDVYIEKLYSKASTKLRA